MRLNFIIPDGLHHYFRSEIAKSENSFAGGKLAEAWYHLERAHILGQAYPVEHTYTHWKKCCSLE